MRHTMSPTISLRMETKGRGIKPVFIELFRVLLHSPTDEFLGKALLTYGESINLLDIFQNQIDLKEELWI